MLAGQPFGSGSGSMPVSPGIRMDRASGAKDAPAGIARRKRGRQLAGQPGRSMMSPGPTVTSGIGVMDTMLYSFSSVILPAMPSASSS